MNVFKVGGCVRDTLLGKTPKDIDYVVVGSTPEEMLSLGFSQVGADFPVFLHPKTNDEYALARIDRKIGNGYLGFETDFSTSVTLKEDAFRRDLTINAMAEDVITGELFDYFGGQEDLNSKTLKHVSDAFSEDPLRVMRLARFATRFDDFTIHPDTLKLCKDLVSKGELDQLPNERFWAELEKVFSEDNPRMFFKTLVDVDADFKVMFFREMFLHERDNVHLALDAAMCFAKEHRLMIFAALMTSGLGETIKSAERYTRNLSEALYDFKRIVSASCEIEKSEALITFLVKVRAFSEGETFSNFLSVIKADNRNCRSLVSWVEETAKATRAVKAETFIAEGFSGKELGRAIFNHRVNLAKNIKKIVY